VGLQRGQPGGQAGRRANGWARASERARGRIAITCALSCSTGWELHTSRLLEHTLQRTWCLLPAAASLLACLPACLALLHRAPQSPALAPASDKRPGPTYDKASPHPSRVARVHSPGHAILVCDKVRACRAVDNGARRGHAHHLPARGGDRRSADLKHRRGRRRRRRRWLGRGAAGASLLAVMCAAQQVHQRKSKAKLPRMPSHACAGPPAVFGAPEH